MDANSDLTDRHILVDEELAKDSTDAEVQPLAGTSSKRKYAAMALLAVGLLCLGCVALKEHGKSIGVSNISNIVAEYDCDAGLSNWDMGWSDGKKRFCCKFKPCHGFVHHYGGGYDAYHHDGEAYHFHHYDEHHYGGEYGGGYETVVIGNTLQENTNHKCVDAPDHVKCDDHAEEMGRTGKYPDKFRISHIGNKICAYRTDSKGAWGLNLVLKCKKDYSSRYATNNYAPNGYEEIHIGNTLSTHASHKCVEDPGDVHCDEKSEQVGRTGEWKDEFKIYHSYGQICARRVDHDGEWGLNLILKCKKTRGGYGSYGRPHDDRYHPLHYEGRWYSQAELKEIYDSKYKYHHDYYSDSYTQEELKRMYEEQNMGHTEFHGYKTVVVGNTLQENTNHKCVDAPNHVRCDDHAEEMGRTGKFPDKFRISHIGNKICAYRTDSKGPWGLNLVLKCKKDYSQRYSTNDFAPHGYKEVHIGNTLDTHNSYKCVEDPGDVHCDAKSEQVGRTGEWKDQFDIYHAHGKICARRTDDDGEWGLNLILKCKKTF